MKANALLMLSFDSPYEAAASGISVGHWRWSVANALKSERERITLRCTDPRNQLLDVQYILGQDVLTEELLKGLTPIDLDDPNSTGNFNSCYLGVISIPAEPNRATLPRVILYFGSATSVYGEVGRLMRHEDLISRDHEEILQLRGGREALLFHEFATLPGAEHRFYAIHRFAQIRDNVQAGFHCRALALACENICIISADKLDFSPRDLEHSKICQQIMDHFKKKRLVPNFQHRFHVANRCQPMTQNSRSAFVFKRDLFQLYDKLTTFYLKTGKLSLSSAEAKQFLEDVEGEGFDVFQNSSGELNHHRIILTYALVLRNYGQVYQKTYYGDYRPHIVAAAGVVRHASLAGLARGPDEYGIYNLDMFRLDWQQAAFEAQRLAPRDRQHYTADSLREMWRQGVRGLGGIARQSLVAKNFEFLRGRYRV
jgi:hypothetical protein